MLLNLGRNIGSIIGLKIRIVVEETAVRGHREVTGGEKV